MIDWLLVLHYLWRIVLTLAVAMGCSLLLVATVSFLEHVFSVED